MKSCPAALPVTSLANTHSEAAEALWLHHANGDDDDVNAPTVFLWGACN